MPFGTGPYSDGHSVCVGVTQTGGMPTALLSHSLSRNLLFYHSPLKGELSVSGSKSVDLLLQVRGC